MSKTRKRANTSRRKLDYDPLPTYNLSSKTSSCRSLRSRNNAARAASALAFRRTRRRLADGPGPGPGPGAF